MATEKQYQAALARARNATKEADEKIKAARERARGSSGGGSSFMGGIKGGLNKAKGLAIGFAIFELVRPVAAVLLGLTGIGAWMDKATKDGKGNLSRAGEDVAAAAVAYTVCHFVKPLRRYKEDVVAIGVLMGVHDAVLPFLEQYQDKVVDVIGGWFGGGAEAPAQSTGSPVLTKQGVMATDQGNARSFEIAGEMGLRGISTTAQQEAQNKRMAAMLVN